MRTSSAHITSMSTETLPGPYYDHASASVATLAGYTDYALALYGPTPDDFALEDTFDAAVLEHEAAMDRLAANVHAGAVEIYNHRHGRNVSCLTEVRSARNVADALDEAMGDFAHEYVQLRRQVFDSALDLLAERDLLQEQLSDAAWDEADLPFDSDGPHAELHLEDAQPILLSERRAARASRTSTRAA